MEQELWFVDLPDGILQADFETVLGWIQEGRVHPTTRVKKGKFNWIEARFVPTFRDRFPVNADQSLPQASLNTQRPTVIDEDQLVDPNDQRRVLMVFQLMGMLGAGLTLMSLLFPISGWPGYDKLLIFGNPSFAKLIVFILSLTSLFTCLLSAHVSLCFFTGASLFLLMSYNFGRVSHWFTLISPSFRLDPGYLSIFGINPADAHYDWGLYLLCLGSALMLVAGLLRIKPGWKFPLTLGFLILTALAWKVTFLERELYLRSFQTEKAPTQTFTMSRNRVRVFPVTLPENVSEAYIIARCSPEMDVTVELIDKSPLNEKEEVEGLPSLQYQEDTNYFATPKSKDELFGEGKEFNDVLFRKEPKQDLKPGQTYYLVILPSLATLRARPEEITVSLEVEVLYRK